MAVDNRVLAILLIVGIFASMTTIALYQGLVGPEPEIRGPQFDGTSGFLVMDVVEPTTETLSDNGGLEDGS